jgi:methionyl-tRNA formyltransferase
MQQTQTVVFLGSKPIGYQCFAHLIGQQDILGYRIIGLLTQQRTEFAGAANLAQLAAQHGIPVLDTPDDLPEADLLYSVQYHAILTLKQLAKARVAALNLHMAPLPEYRGANQFSMALLDGKTEFGTTIHLMDARIDHGAILFQKRFPIPESCWVEDLYTLTEAASLELFKDTLPDVLSGTYIPVPQQDLEVQYGSQLHYKSEIRALKELPEASCSEQLLRTVRATSMPGFEPPYLRTASGEKIYLVREKDLNR